MNCFLQELVTSLRREAKRTRAVSRQHSSPDLLLAHQESKFKECDLNLQGQVAGDALKQYLPSVKYILYKLHV